jgi:hypothetical protein
MEGEQDPWGDDYLYHSEGSPSSKLGLKLQNHCQEETFGLAFSYKYVKTIIIKK